jgi:hypothetical protein
MYAWFGEPVSGLIPATYGVVTLTSFVALRRYGGWRWFRTSQLVLIFVLPFALMWSLGGYIPGSAVMIWAILAPIGSLWEGRSRGPSAGRQPFSPGRSSAASSTPTCGMRTTFPTH